MVERKFRKIDQNFVNLGDENKSVEGTLTEKGSMSFRNEDSGEMVAVGRYKMTADPGEGESEGTVSIVLGSTVIDDLLEPFPIGTYVKLDFVGWDRSNPDRPLKLIELSVAE